MEVNNRVLYEAQVSFPVAPRTRNGHEVGGKSLFKNLELFVGGFATMRMRVPYGIWARMDSAETVSYIIVDWQCKHVGEVCDECQ